MPHKHAEVMELKATLDNKLERLKDLEVGLKTNSESWSILKELHKALMVECSATGEPIDLSSNDEMECTAFLIQNDIYTVQVQTAMRESCQQIESLLDEAKAVLIQLAEIETEGGTSSEFSHILGGLDGPRRDWEKLFRKLAAMIQHCT